MNDITEMLDLYIDARKNSTPNLMAYIVTLIQLVLVVASIRLLYLEYYFYALICVLIGFYGVFNAYIIIRYHNKKNKRKALE